MSRAFRLFQAGKLRDAKRICDKVPRSDPAHADASHCLGLIEQRLGRPDRAVGYFEQVLGADPGYIPVYGSLANALVQLGRVAEARQLVDRALQLRPEAALANRALGDLAGQAMEYVKAEAFYRRALAADPRDGHSHAALGNTLRRLGRLDEALDCYERAVQLEPGNAIVWLNRGNILSDMGRIDDAVTSYRESIRLKPDHARSYQLLAGIRRAEMSDAELAAMERLYHRSGLPAEDRMNLAFGLGKACEDRDQYDRAFEFIKEGNRVHRRLLPYSIEEDEALFARLTAVFDADFFRERVGCGRADRTPIFVLGLPRSGTSLVEQILASHPRVHGAGELADMELLCRQSLQGFPECVAELPTDTWGQLADQYLHALRGHEPSVPHVTDKMPQNFLYIGMIAVMLPNARIVHCCRDPMDNCWSLFKSLFFSTGHGWSYDLDDLGRYYRLYRRLMAHWHRVLPGRVYDLQYEDLVADPETQIRSLLDHCGLDFDPACLSFHESRRAVRTLSFAQVRQPIYGSSVELWRRYEKHLRPLAGRLSAV